MNPITTASAVNAEYHSPQLPCWLCVNFAVLLFGAALITIGKRGTPQISRIDWNDFIKQYVDRDYFDMLGACEFTDFKTILSKIKLEETYGKEKRAPFYFLRLGAYDEDGETTTVESQFKFNMYPPSFNRKIRTAQRTCFLSANIV